MWWVHLDGWHLKRPIFMLRKTCTFIVCLYQRSNSWLQSWTWVWKCPNLFVTRLYDATLCTWNISSETVYAFDHGDPTEPSNKLPKVVFVGHTGMYVEFCITELIINNRSCTTNYSGINVFRTSIYSLQKNQTTITWNELTYGLWSCSVYHVLSAIPPSSD